MVKAKKSASRSVILSPHGENRFSRLSSNRVLTHLVQNGKDLKSSLESLEKSLNLLDLKASFLVSPQTCSICAFNFNNQDRLPICLPCGHSICKTCVYSLKHSSLTGVCPYDRKEYFFIQELLPVNFSLLYTENLEESRTCEIHGFEIVAFCLDHSLLLCGKCLISHLSHKFLDIESETVKQIALKKADVLETWEKNAHDFELNWISYFDELTRVLIFLKQDSNREPFKSIQRFLEKSLKSEKSQQFLKISQIVLKIQQVKKKFFSFNVFQQLKAEFLEFNLKFPHYSGLEELLKLAESPIIT